MHNLIEEPTLSAASNLNGPRRALSQEFLLCCIVVMLLAASLRLYHISERSLWFDEAIAANISRGTLGHTLVLTRNEHSAPIIHPLVLYAVEKTAAGPLAVRTPSFVASLLAVFLMLCFVTIPSFDRKTALLSALMLGMSALQIRYAQEVREYSLSVLYATLLTYLFMAYSSRREGRGSLVPLYLALFAAPLVQYGLVLFGFGVLAALVVLGLNDRRWRIRILEVTKASVFLGAGGLASYMLTLRYQWGETPSYLRDHYLTPDKSVAAFVLSNTHHLVTSFLPGLAAAVISLVAILFYVVTPSRSRVVSPLFVLAVTSLGVVLACALLHVYPYGGVRQCLFLAPVLCLVASTSLVQIANRFAGTMNRVVFVAIASVVVVSGVFQIRHLKPYAEVEDIHAVLSRLQTNVEPGDGVYIYFGAVPATDFYVKERDSGFMYGDFHRQSPDKFASEMLAGLCPGTNRIWIVFSHVYEDEDQRILNDLSGNWEVASVLTTKGSALYMARRRSAVAPDASTDRDPSCGGKLVAATQKSVTQRPYDSFWDWNIRNLGPPGQ
jgi:hypothetical protein